MSESEQVEAHVPITISIDVDQLLRSELGWTAFNAGSSVDPELDYAPGGNGRIIDVVADKLAAKLYDQTKVLVGEAVKERALDRVDDLIDEIMDERMILTSAYGEPQGEPTTLRAAMIKAMTDRLEEQVDDSGKRLGRDRYSYGGKGFTYLHWRATKVAKDILDKELSTQLVDATRTIRDKAKTMVSQKIADVLEAGL